MIPVLTLPSPGSMALSTSTLPPVSFDFTTAAVVSFVIVLLGMAAALLLMIRFAGRRESRRGE